MVKQTSKYQDSKFRNEDSYEDYVRIVGLNADDTVLEALWEEEMEEEGPNYFLAGGPFANYS